MTEPRERFWEDRTNRILLLVVAVLGVTATLRNTVFAPAAQPAYAIGADMSEVQLVDVAGGTSSVATGARTALFVFHSKCGWCEQVAADWSTWFEANPDTRVIAVTIEDVRVGSSYARRHGWTVDVRQIVGATERGTPAHAIGARTPAIITVGPDGTLEAVVYNSDVRLDLAGLDSLFSTGGAG